MTTAPTRTGFDIAIDRAADRRTRLLTDIRTSIETHQRPPTPAELADAEESRGYPRIDRSTVQDDLKALERAGFIHLDKAVVRGIRLAGVRVHLEPVQS